MTRERLVRPGSKTAAKAAFVTFVAASLFIGVPAAAQTPKPDAYFVPDVVAQFSALALRPEPFGMWVWGHPEPSDNVDKHYQGIARSQGPGIPHMYLAWNGNDSGCIDCDDEPGQLFVIRMLSRDATGERLRSNRLYPGHPMFAIDEYGSDVGTPPDLRDCLVGRIVFDGTGGWPHYRTRARCRSSATCSPCRSRSRGPATRRCEFSSSTSRILPCPVRSAHSS